MTYSLETFEQELTELVNTSSNIDTATNLEYFYNKAVESQLPVMEMVRISNRIINPDFPITKIFLTEKLRLINLDLTKLNL